MRRKVQELLRPVLDSVYRSPSSVHGFVADRSVASNAKEHVGQRTIVNIDIQNCFDTISFYRVRGLFLRPPFSFPRVTATILAHACTWDTKLPAGGVTSPVIMNLLLGGLDKALDRLTKKSGGIYTRYADDLTLSFRQRPAQLSSFVVTNSLGHYEVAPILASEITKQGFEINPSKFRVSTGTSRKEVTGLVVNRRVNLRRRWLRSLESQVYAIEKFGLGSFADKEFPTVPLVSRSLTALRHVQGKIAYASMVRGRFDWVTASLAYRLNAAHSHRLFKVPDVEKIERVDRVHFGVWIVATGGDGEDLFDPPYGNGTAFTVDRGYIATADHVVVEDGKVWPVITVRREDDPTKLYECDLVARCANSDIAILKLRDPNHSITRIRFRLAGDVAHGSVKSFGFPQYYPGHKTHNESHQITGVVPASGIKRLRLTGTILGGMSGGPVLDEECGVVGVVHKGIAEGGYANEAISVSHLKTLIDTLP
jgi:retron-type reverse transcriptase